MKGRGEEMGTENGEENVRDTVAEPGVREFVYDNVDKRAVSCHERCKSEVN